jgi:TetR/AcrR family transcriptional regulator
MGTTERRERERQARIEAILDAAEKVAEEKGLQAATMDDIAAVVELGKSTVYLYFKSKEAVYLGLDLRGSRIQKQMFAVASETAGTGLDKVVAIGRAYFEYAEQYSVYFRAKAHLGPVTPEKLQEYKDDPMFVEHGQTTGEINRILVGAIKAGQEDGSIRTDLDAIVIGLLLWGESNGVAEMISNRKVPLKQFLGIEPKAIAESFFELLRKSLSPGAE